MTIARMRIGGGPGRMAADALLSALAKEEPAMLRHAHDVASLAAHVARVLGLDPRVVEAFCSTREALPVAV